MNFRFYNGKIAPLDEREPFWGELWIRGNRIAFCGTKEEAEKRRLEQEQGLRGEQTEIFHREINLEGNLILPGFKNAHTHSAMTFLRSRADDLPLMEWLQKQVFPMEAKLKGEDVYWLSTLAIMEYLTGGITANFDMYFFPEENVRASIDSGFRTVLCGAVNDFQGSLEELREQYDAFCSIHDRIGFLLGFHAEYTCSPSLLEGIAALAHEYHAPVFTHNSETKGEVAGCKERYGLTPTVYLDKLGMFDFGGGGFHCVYLTEEDMDIFANKGLFAVSNPGSNGKLASGIAPLQKMQKRGIPIALGTDGPASNNALDMFREMYLAAVFQKLHMQDASALKAGDILKMACVTGAEAMGLRDCTSLAEGNLADLTVIDLQRPNMQPENHLLNNLVYSGGKENIVLTMVDGRILYERGEFFIGKDPKEVYARANEIIRRMGK